jgi:hypothetical protein
MHSLKFDILSLLYRDELWRIFTTEVMPRKRQGKTLTEICRELEAAGVRLPLDGQWTVPRLTLLIDSLAWGRKAYKPRSSRVKIDASSVDQRRGDARGLYANG